MENFLKSWNSLFAGKLCVGMEQRAWSPVLRIHLILMRILIRSGKKWIRIRTISLYDKTWWNHSEIKKYFKSLFSIVQIWVLRVNIFLVDILPFGSRSVDPHILRIRIQEAKILRIQRIRILSTELEPMITCLWVYSIYEQHCSLFQRWLNKDLNWISYIVLLLFSLFH